MKHLAFGTRLVPHTVLVGLTFAAHTLAQGAHPSAEPAPTAPASTAQSPTPSAVPVSAPSPVYELESGVVILVHGETKTPVSIPSPVSSATYHEGQLYVTHGTATVSVYSCDNPEVPVLVDTLSTGRGVATGVEIIADKLWVLTVSHQAVPLGEMVPTSAAVTLAADNVSGVPSSVPSVASVATVDQAVKVVEPGTIEIAAGAGNNVRIGDRFTIYRETTVGNQDSDFKGEELVALAEVVAVKEDSALAELSRNAIVSSHDVARAAREDQTESNIYPVRVAHVGEVGGTLRPIVNAGSPLGVGALAELYGSYWGQSYFVNLIVQPLGLGWTDKGNIVSTSALLEGGYDARAFSVGLGVGISAINGDTDAMLDSTFGYAEDAGSVGEVEIVDKQETHSAFTLSQWVRLGARDGLNLALRNQLILHKDSDTDEAGFFYGGTIGKLSVPLDRRNDLFLEGGGGVMGYWLVGAGVGTWVTGNGSPGSWKMSISAGAAGIWGTKEVTTTTSTYTSTYNEDVEVAGPMVSLGLSRRFGF